MSKKITAHLVAEAICKVCKLAGQAYDVNDPQPIATRVENLLRDRAPYGAYIVDGDPQKWGGGSALVTIYMEPKGTPGDCFLPIDYDDGGFEVATDASDLLPDAYIEFINAAVACVYKT